MAVGRVGEGRGGKNGGSELLEIAPEVDRRAGERLASMQSKRGSLPSKEA
jgi:hypothetical protein